MLGKTQAGLVYLLTALSRAGYAAEVVDLSGTFGFYDPPEELYCSCDSPEWMSPDGILRGEWMDEYLPPAEVVGDLVFFSAQFSPDLVFHARYSHNLRKSNPKVTTAIGGAALAGLREEQLDVAAMFFDHVLVGYDVEALLCHALDHKGQRARQGEIVKAMAAPGFSPDYSLVPLGDFVSVYTGHGCYYGRCRFCDFPSRAEGEVSFRAAAEVAADIKCIQAIRPGVRDIFLTHDSYSCHYLQETLSEVERHCGHVPFSLMLRAEPWVTEELGEQLAKLGCTNVFIGAEGLDDEILQLLNKGLSTESIVRVIRALSKFVDITIGMILFVPNVSKIALDSQLRQLEAILPFVRSIEPEILTVVNGSEFAESPSDYGIILNATERVINDSWCFGLSHDIPWTMSDPRQIETWFRHAAELRRLYGDRVEPTYWTNVDRLKADVG